MAESIDLDALEKAVRCPCGEPGCQAEARDVTVLSLIAECRELREQWASMSAMLSTAVSDLSSLRAALAAAEKERDEQRKAAEALAGLLEEAELKCLALERAPLVVAPFEGRDLTDEERARLEAIHEELSDREARQWALGEQLKEAREKAEAERDEALRFQRELEKNLDAVAAKSVEWESEHALEHVRAEKAEAALADARRERDYQAALATAREVLLKKRDEDLEEARRHLAGERLIVLAERETRERAEAQRDEARAERDALRLVAPGGAA